MRQARLRKPKTLSTDDALLTVLERARAVGFLGPGPLRVHLDHARMYLRHLSPEPRRVIDLGSGGGLPGLPLFVDRPDCQGVLLDASQKRGSFLVWALSELQLTDRVSVVVDRAERRAHDDDFRESFDLVVCRGFGPPAVTVECSAGYLADGGRLLISEPPGGRAWPDSALGDIGLVHRNTGDEVAVFDRVAKYPAELPRNAKQMKKSPLFAL